MPRDNWLFDEQGRMRADVPPLIHSPDRPPAYLGLNALAPQPDSNALTKPAQDLVDRLGLEVQPGILGGWKVKPKRWKNPEGPDWYGLMFTRDISL